MPARRFIIVSGMSGAGKSTALHALDGAPALWIVDPDTNTVALRPVEVLAWREDTVEIAGGVDVDDLVVVAGVHKLHPGQTVRPVDRDNRAVGAD